jgi:hypothetical protein
VASPDTPLRIFIGFDEAETVAYHVLAHSIMARTRMPVAITPLMSRTLSAVYTRPRSATQATDFSFTRFLVPYLSGYQGVSLFMDCDMLMRGAVEELGEYLLQDRGAAVFCCQHDYVPTSEAKFLGREQKAYPRKNWSSFMMFRNARCLALTPDYVSQASAADLHRFAWLKGEPGQFPLEWNYLVGEPNQATVAPKNVHWTIGGPWFPEYADAPFADEWRATRDAMLKAG